MVSGTGIDLGIVSCVCSSSVFAQQPYSSTLFGPGAGAYIGLVPWCAMPYICFAYIVPAQLFAGQEGTVRLFKLAVIVDQHLSRYQPNAVDRQLLVGA